MRNKNTFMEGIMRNKIITLLSQGCSIQDTAELLGISEEAVHVYTKTT